MIGGGKTPKHPENPCENSSAPSFSPSAQSSPSLASPASPRNLPHPIPWFAQFTDYPLVIAHADDSGKALWPGDTLHFLQNSAALGVDVLEMNVHTSKDGVIVLIHDDTVDDSTNGTGTVSNMNLADLQMLEVGTDWTSDEGQTFPFRGMGLRIPTLESVSNSFPITP
ncbi:MAG: hypothetical protein HC806_01135 [Anaerolineae bacterium]|nr:hypothetical protein [Anaerolineae bacterium]